MSKNKKFIMTVKLELEVECKDKETAIKLIADDPPKKDCGGYGLKEGSYSYKTNGIFCILSCIESKKKKECEK